MTEKQCIEMWFHKIDTDFDSCTFEQLEEIIKDIIGDLMHSGKIITYETWSLVNQICKILDFNLHNTSISVIKDRIKHAHIISEYIEWQE